MKKFSKLTRLFIVAMLSLLMVLSGVTALSPSTVKAEDSMQTVASEWYELKYSKDALEFRLSDNYREYLDINKSEAIEAANELVSGLVSAVKGIVMDSILQGNGGVMFATGSIGAGDVVLPDGFWDDEGLSDRLKEFKGYITDRLSNPDELTSYLDGEYNMLLEYAIGTYVESQTKNGATAEEVEQIYSKINNAIDEVVQEAIVIAEEKVLTQEAVKALGDGATAQEIEQYVQNNKGAYSDEWNQKSQEVVSQTVANVKENGGKVPSIGVSDLIAAFKGVKINGNEIYSKLNGINLSGIRSLVNIFPLPAEIANMDAEALRNLISFDVMVQTTFGDVRFKVTFGFFGDTRAIQKAAGVIAEYIDVALDGNHLSIEAKLPEVFASAALKLTETKYFSDEIKNKVFTLFSTSVEGMFDTATGYTYDELLGFIKSVDYQKWFNNFLNGDFIYTYFDKYFEQVFGRGLDEADIDRVINAFARYAQAFANRDVTYDKALNFLNQNVPGFDKLSGRISSDRLEALVNKLLGYVNNVDWAKYDAEYVRDVLANSTTFNDTIYSYIEKFAPYGNVYDKFVEYAQKIFDYLPQKAKDGTVLDLYDGNGEFSFDGSFTLDLDKVADKIKSVLTNRGFESIANYVDYALVLLEQRTFTLDLSLNLSAPGVYKIEYAVADEVLRQGLLPVGADVNLFAPKTIEGYDILYWTDAQGKKVTEMPTQDTTLYAVTEFTAQGLVNGEQGNSVDELYHPNLAYNLSVAVDGVSFAQYDYQWYFGEQLIASGNELAATQNGAYTVVVTDLYTGIQKEVDFDVNVYALEVEISANLVAVSGGNVDGDVITYVYDGQQKVVAWDVAISALNNSGAWTNAEVEALFATVTNNLTYVNASQEILASIIVELDAAYQGNVVATVNGEALEDMVEVTTAWVIEKAELELEYAWDYTDAFTYNAGEHTVSATLSIANTDAFDASQLFDLANLIYTNNIATNAGEYTATVEATLVDTDNFVIANVEGNELAWAIEKAELELEYAWDYTDAFIYNASEHTVSATLSIVNTDAFDASQLFDLANLIYTNNIATNAGEYTATVEATLIDTDNFVIANVEGNELAWAIEKAHISIEFAWNYQDAFTYNGGEFTVGVESIRILDSQVFDASIFDLELVEYQGKTVETLAGQYEVTADVTNALTDGNIIVDLVTNPTLSWQIQKAKIAAPTNTWSQEEYTFIVGEFSQDLVVYEGIAAQNLDLFDVSEFGYFMHLTEQEVTADALMTGIGNYEVRITVSLKDADNYEIENSILTSYDFYVLINVNPITLDLQGATWYLGDEEFDGSELIYDGVAKEFTLSGVAQEVLANVQIVYYTVVDGVAADKLDGAPANPGMYMVTVVAKTNYTLANKPSDEFFFVDKAGIAILPVAQLSEVVNNNYVWSVELDVEVEEGVYDYVVDADSIFTADEAGEYEVYVEFTIVDGVHTFKGLTLPENYQMSEDGLSIIVTLTWEAIDLRVYLDGAYFAPAAGLVYDGNAHGVILENVSEQAMGTFQIVYFADNNGERGDKLQSEPINAGTYWASVEAVGEYDLVNAPNDYMYIIRKAFVDEPHATVGDVQYDNGQWTVSVDVDESEYYTSLVAGELTVTAEGDYTATATFTINQEYNGNYSFDPEHHPDNYEVMDDCSKIVITLTWNAEYPTLDLDGVALTFDGSYVYDGEAKEYALSRQVEHVAIVYYTSVNGIKDAKLSDAPVNVGEYIVTVEGLDGYKLANAPEARFQITKATITNPTASLTDKVFVDGEWTVEVNASESADYSEGAISGDLSASEVGTYVVTVTFTLTDASNYQFNAEHLGTNCQISEDGKYVITLTWTVTEIPDEIVDLDGASLTFGGSLVYNGSAKEYTLSGNYQGVKVVYYIDINGEKGAKLNGAPANAGKYIVTVEGLDGYNAVNAPEVRFEITKATVTNPTASLTQAEFVDGEWTVEANASVSEYYTNGDISGDLSASAVGEYTVTVTFTLIDASNYQFDAAHLGANCQISSDGTKYVITLTWTVTEMPDETVDLDGATLTFDGQLVYNGENKQFVLNGVSAEDMEKVEIVYYTDVNGERGEKLTRAPENAGKYIVTVEAKQGYELINAPEVNFEIAKLIIDLPTAEIYSQEFNQDEWQWEVEVSKSESIYYYDGVVNGDLSANRVGTFTVTVDFTLMGPANVAFNTQNLPEGYTLSPDGATVQIVLLWTVEEMPDEIVDLDGAALTFGGSYVYDGEAKQFVLSGISAEDADKVEIVYYTDENGEKGAKLNGAPANAGKYIVTVEAKAGYELQNAPSDYSFEITKATIANPQVSLTDPVNANGTWSVEVRLIESEYYTASIQGDVTATAAGTYTVTVTFTLVDANNYTFANGATFVTTLTWSVEGTQPDPEPVPGKTFSQNGISVTDVDNVIPEGHAIYAQTAGFDINDYRKQLRQDFADHKATFGIAYEIHFVDGDGARADIDGNYLVSMAVPTTLSGFTSFIAMHIMADGTIEYVECVVVDGKIQFYANGFSVYAIFGMEELPEPVGDWWIYVLLAILGVAVIGAIVFFLLKIKGGDNEPTNDDKQTSEQGEEEVEEAAEEAVEEATEQPAEEVVEEVTEQPAEEVVEEVTEQPAEEVVEEVTEQPAEEVVEEVTEQPAEEVVEEVTEQPAEEVVEEVTEQPAQTIVEESTATQEVAIDKTVPFLAYGQTGVAYDRSFEARLSQASDELKNAYSEIKNHILSYKKVGARMSWKFESFNRGRVKVAKMQIRGKNIYMYIALDPDTLDGKYHHKSVKDKKSMAATPTRLRVRSGRSVKYAKELIDMVMAELGLAVKKDFEAVDYVAANPYKTTEELISVGLIKVKNVGSLEGEVAATEQPAQTIVEESTATQEVAIDKTVPFLAYGQTGVAYDRSFEARLSQASDELKNAYSEIKNHILSYKKVGARMSWKFESFNRGRVKVAKMQIRGKNIYMFIALDPDTLDGKYHHKSVKDKKSMAATPTKIRVRSGRSVKYAKELIDMVMAELGLALKKDFEAVDYVAANPYKTTEELISVGLIKVKSVGSLDGEAIATEPAAVVEAPVVIPEPVVMPEPQAAPSYNRSFEARLSQSEDELKNAYSEIKNHILSYKKVGARMSWKFESFNRGRVKVAKMQIRGKNIYMFIALDPDTLDGKYHHKSVKGKKALAATPTKFRVRSGRSVKYAKELIDLAMAGLQIELRKKFEPVDYVAANPFKTNEELVSDGAIKVKQSSGAPSFLRGSSEDQNN